MVRTYWNATLVAALALPALVWGQHVSMPVAAQSEEMISVKEAGKPEQRCRILKVWQTADGATARQVQALDTGEIMTIVEIGAGTVGQMPTAAPAAGGIVTRIFHWGHNQSTPAGVPAAPMGSSAFVSGTPCTSCTAPGTTVMSGTPCPTCSPGGSSPTIFSGPNPVVSGPASPCTTCQPGAAVIGRVTPAPSVSSSVAVSETAPEHVPFWKHWFQREPYVIPTQPPKSMVNYTLPSSQTTVVQTPAKPATSPTATATTTPAKTPTDSPQPTDWRRSWGKADLSQAQAPAKPATDGTKTADSSKPQATDKKAVAQDTTKPAPKPAATAAKPAAAPAKPAVAANTPKQNSTTPGKEAPGSVKGMSGMDLPRADNKKTDPLNTPDHYSKQLETKLKESATVGLDGTKKTPDTAPAKKPAPVVAKEDKDAKKKTEPVVAAAAVTTAAAAAVSTAPGSASTHPNSPLGAQSVLAAYQGQPGAVCYLPVPMVTLPASVPPGMTQPVTPAAPAEKTPAPAASKDDDSPANAFTAVSSNTPSDNKMMANAFSSGSMGQQPAGYPAGGYPQPGMMMPPMAMMPAMPMRPGMPASVAQAGFMGPNGMVLPPYYPQPGMMPGQPMPGMMPGQPMPGMMPGQPMPGQPMPGMMPGQSGMLPVAAYQASVMPPMPSVSQSAAEQQNTSQLLLTMHDSVYPSYREWAAEALAASGSNRHNSQVVDALTAAAKDDPAATVRAACIRCLVKMHVNTTPAVTTIQGLKSDPDPRVRSAAEQALTGLGIPQTVEAPLQPASASVPADKATPPAGGISLMDEHK